VKCGLEPGGGGRHGLHELDKSANFPKVSVEGRFGQVAGLGRTLLMSEKSSHQIAQGDACSDGCDLKIINTGLDRDFAGQPSGGGIFQGTLPFRIIAPGAEIKLLRALRPGVPDRFVPLAVLVTTQWKIGVRKGRRDNGVHSASCVVTCVGPMNGRCQATGPRGENAVFLQILQKWK
jgi:hypothetical protein